MSLPFVITSKVKTPSAELAVIGPADALKAAFESGTPITLTGKLEGEQVFLGHTRATWDDGEGRETIGLDHMRGESPKFPGVTVAAYLVDMTRLEGAPTLLDLKKKADVKRLANAMAAEARAEKEDARLDNLAEDGA
jgi:hypothetical protein